MLFLEFLSRVLFREDGAGLRAREFVTPQKESWHLQENNARTEPSGIWG